MIAECTLRRGFVKRWEEEQTIERGRGGEEEHGPLLCLDLSPVPFSLPSKCHGTN